MLTTLNVTVKGPTNEETRFNGCRHVPWKLKTLLYVAPRMDAITALLARKEKVASNAGTREYLLQNTQKRNQIPMWSEHQWITQKELWPSLHFKFHRRCPVEADGVLVALDVTVPLGVVVFGGADLSAAVDIAFLVSVESQMILS